MIETLMDETAIANVVKGIVERNMRGISIAHAKARGADQKTLDDLEKMSGQGAFHVVTLLYGEPKFGPQTPDPTSNLVNPDPAKLTNSNKWIAIRDQLRQIALDSK